MVHEYIFYDILIPIGIFWISVFRLLSIASHYLWSMITPFVHLLCKFYHRLKFIFLVIYNHDGQESYLDRYPNFLSVFFTRLRESSRRKSFQRNVAHPQATAFNAATTTLLNLKNHSFSSKLAIQMQSFLTHSRVNLQSGLSILSFCDI